MDPARKAHLQESIQQESKKFEEYYLWIQQHLPQSFFADAVPENIVLVTHTLMWFDLQDYFSQIHFKNCAISLCLDSPDADLQILSHYRDRGIKNYRTFVSNEPPPFPGVTQKLRVGIIYFTEFHEEKEPHFIDPHKKQEIYSQVKVQNPEVSEQEFDQLLSEMNARFLRSLTKERLILAYDVLFRAKKRDPCQYEVRRIEDWKSRIDRPSLQIVLAWRNTPKHDFLYRLAKVVHRHGLALKRVAATYIDPYSRQPILLMSLGLHGAKGKAAWEEADLDDFLQELVTVKYFPGQELIESTFVDSGLVRGNLGNLLKAMASFIHQVLVHQDTNLYSYFHIEEGLCRHPELTVMITKAFEAKFHPEKHDLTIYEKIKTTFLGLVDQLDTGHESYDARRKNILRQALSFIEFALKTNFYRKNKTAFSFRLDPRYLSNVPYDALEKFPEIPFAIFFMKGLHFIGFHIRFRDLSRGGLRTVYPEHLEQLHAERNLIFSECYNLALTQQKKNKDIPEGGAKGVILLEPYEQLHLEEEIYQCELEHACCSPDVIKEKISQFHKEHKLEYLYQAQRSYIESFVTILNCEPNGTLRAKHIVDYYKRPEYIYLGPDENMHDAMIVWIANYPKRYLYKPGTSFMTGKPGAGINHKEFGVTSRGINVYMEEVLKFLDIEPSKDSFTIKMTGGPDGDVAGNQMYNLYKFYPKTAKLLATTDISGTIFDPQGLNLEIVATLFKEAKPIRFYPAEKLSEGGFLLDINTKREESIYAQQTLCLVKKNGKLREEWLSGSEMNHILRTHIHQVKADIFIPGGGRPRTLNENNYKDFLDDKGNPTSKAIIEGANLYLTPGARRELEKLGTLIIKDSSANKGGVICSSYEVICGLTLSESEFLMEKSEIVKELIEIIENRSRDEAKLLLRSHGTQFLTAISEEISRTINQYTDELALFLATRELPTSEEDPLIQCLLNYVPPLLKKKYAAKFLKEVPEMHKKAIIACFLGQRLVYRRGLQWSPSIVDVLPLIINDQHLLTN